VGDRTRGDRGGPTACGGAAGRCCCCWKNCGCAMAESGQLARGSASSAAEASGASGAIIAAGPFDPVDEESADLTELVLDGASGAGDVGEPSDAHDDDHEVEAESKSVISRSESRTQTNRKEFFFFCFFFCCFENRMSGAAAQSWSRYFLSTHVRARCNATGTRLTCLRIVLGPSGQLGLCDCRICRCDKVA
jgi:hypothetical protein